MRKVLALVTCAALTGCATFKNPISLNQIGAAESSYGIALSAAVAYRNLPLCKTGTVASATNVCAQRSIVVKIQAADRQALAAIHAANDFVKNNPTLDATAVITAAQSALSALQQVEATYGVH